MELEALYRAYFDDVFRYLRRLSGDEQLAEEITADTFFKAMHALDDFRGDCDVRVWLCQIARNSYLTHLKKRGRTEPIEDSVQEHLAAPDEPIDERLIRQEEAAQMRRLLHALPEPHREVFLWRVFAELSFAQIGQLFGKSENWACVTYHRARAKIRKGLEESGNEK